MVLEPRADRRGPLVVGGTLALLSAVLFGLSTPLVKRFGVDVGAWTTAALLYAGAALASVFRTRPRDAEAPVARRHAGRIAVVAALGALIAPACLAWGLHHTSATFAS